MKKFRVIALIMLLSLIPMNNSYASNAYKESYKESNIAKYEQPGNGGLSLENLESEQKKLEEIKKNPEKYNAQVLTESQFKEKAKERQEKKDTINSKKAKMKEDADKEYKRVEIENKKMKSLEEIFKGAEHPEIYPSTPTEAGFDPKKDREFYYFTTQKGNKYYLIKDHVAGKDKLTLVTEAREADLLYLLNDTRTSEQFLKEEERKLLEEEKEAREQQKILENIKNNNQEKEEKVEIKETNQNKKIYLASAGILVLLLIIVAVIKLIMRKKAPKYDYDEEDR